jgi:hypothetical protein
VPAELRVPEKALDDGIHRHVRAILANICSLGKASASSVGLFAFRKRYESVLPSQVRYPGA